MRDRDYTSSSDFLKRLFGETLHNVELRAFPNINGEPGSAVAFTRDASDIQAFCARKDNSGFGVYFGTCTRRSGADSGNLTTIVECPALWVDIDCVKQGLTGKEAMDALAFLPFAPSIVINSGGGLHVYWVLEEPVDVSEGAPAREIVAAALKALVGVLAGDMKSTDLARVMRLPGTMNTKEELLVRYGGKPALCEIVEDSGRVHDLEQLCEWLSQQRALLHGKVQPAKPVREDDPFVAYARQAGYEPAIDIDDELAVMEHGGSDRTAIHPTQLRVSASMIARGYEDDEIVDRILKATEAVAPNDRQWNWAAEERAIRKMIQTGRGKGYAEKRERPSQPMVSGNNALAVIHDLSQEREKRKPEGKAERQKLDDISALGSAVLNVWQERYGSIIHSRGTSYVYEGGVWATWDEQHDQMLRVMMQEACSSLGLAPKSSLISSASAFFLNRPSLLIRDVEFDQHDLIIAEDGTVNPFTGERGEHNPDNRAMFKVGAKLEGPRECPAFVRFLRDSFADKPADEIDDILRTIQEWFGACLIANKSRSLAKGMLVHGGSRTGKTQLSEVLRALLGRGQTSATSAGDIGTDFGLQPFLGRRGWIADDAIGQDEYLDAERYKKIVTGEEVGVRRKNRTDVMARFGFPVMLTANHLPKIKDQSDAVYNRSLVLPMTHVRPESAPEPAGYHSISAKIVAEELTGVLWWAIEGWKRLSARGVFTPPPCMTRAVTEMQDNNNPVRSWLKECVVADAETKVANSDLFASFAGWYYQENGESRFLWSQNGFIRRLREMMPNLGKQAGAKTRNTTGLRLTQDGLEYWSINVGRDSNQAPKGASLEAHLVNQDYSVSHAERVLNGREPRF